MDEAICPICTEKIEFSQKVKHLERISCPTCEALLEVVNLDPIEVDWIFYDYYGESNERDQSKVKKNTKCPLCKENVHIGSHLKVGDQLRCPGCDAQLEIVSLYPAELDWPYDGYDYYYQDDDFYEEEL